MKKVTGKPIKYKKAKELQEKAKGFHLAPAITTAVSQTGGDAETFFKNLNCGFVFDRDSLAALFDSIKDSGDKGLVMMLGASDITQAEILSGDDASRQNKPTLSVFACTIDRKNDTYALILNANEDDTDGVEHPGIVSFDNNPGFKIEKGPISLLDL